MAIVLYMQQLHVHFVKCKALKSTIEKQFTKLFKQRSHTRKLGFKLQRFNM